MLGGVDCAPVPLKNFQGVMLTKSPRSAQFDEENKKKLTWGILPEEITKTSQNAFQNAVVWSRGGSGDGGRGEKQQASGECALSKHHN